MMPLINSKLDDPFGRQNGNLCFTSSSSLPSSTSDFCAPNWFAPGCPRAKLFNPNVAHWEQNHQLHHPGKKCRTLRNSCSDIFLYDGAISRELKISSDSLAPFIHWRGFPPAVVAGEENFRSRRNFYDCSAEGNSGRLTDFSPGFETSRSYLLQWLPRRWPMAIARTVQSMQKKKQNEQEKVRNKHGFLGKKGRNIRNMNSLPGVRFTEFLATKFNQSTTHRTLLKDGTFVWFSPGQYPC